MKRFIYTSWLVCLLLSANAQVTLEKTYNYSTTVVNLESLGYKYYLMDVPNSQCRIYNMDHSIYQTITCPVPGGFYLSDLKYVSQTLFDSDSEIELVYTYSKYVPTSTSYYYVFGSGIINASGTTVIPAIDNAQYMIVNKTGNAEYKLFAYCLDYSVTPEKAWTKIYSLPGNLFTAAVLTDDSQQFLHAYPNPATDIIRIEYALQAHVQSATLSLVDMNGRAVKNYEVDAHSDHLAISTHEFASGIYHCILESGNQRTALKKIVIR